MRFLSSLFMKTLIIGSVAALGGAWGGLTGYVLFEITLGEKDAVFLSVFGGAVACVIFRPFFGLPGVPGCVVSLIAGMCASLAGIMIGMAVLVALPGLFVLLSLDFVNLLGGLVFFLGVCVFLFYITMSEPLVLMVWLPGVIAMHLFCMRARKIRALDGDAPWWLPGPTE